MPNIDDIIEKALDAALDGKPVRLTRDEYKEAYRAGRITYGYFDSANKSPREPRLCDVLVQVEWSPAFQADECEAPK